MRHPRWIVGPLAIAVAIAVTPPPVAGQAGLTYEDFNTTLHRDSGNTTAWWDTLSSQIKLHPFSITQTGAEDTPSSAFGVAVSGNYAYVVDTGVGLVVIDISDPSSPTTVTTYPMSGSPTDVQVDGDLVYVTADASDLYVLNISNPASPTLVKYYDGPNNAHGIVVAGDYAFISDAYYGVYVYNIVNPANPTLVGSYDTPGVPFGLALAGRYLYVADGTSGLLVLDVHNPTAPSYAGGVDTPGDAARVTVAGSYAYVADKAAGVQVVDVSDPSTPSIVGTYDTPGEARDVSVSGQLLYVADKYSGIHVLDVSTPSSPSYVGGYDTPGEAWAVVPFGDQALVADGSAGLEILNVSSELTPPRSVGSYASTGHPQCVTIAGNLAYTAGDNLEIYDLSDPTSPSLVGSAGYPGVPGTIAAYGNYLYGAAEHSYGVAVYDVSDPANPAWVQTYYSSGYPSDVVVRGNYAYVSDGGTYYATNGLRILSLADPANPTLAGSHDLVDVGDAQALALAGDYAYMAVYADGLVVFDISNTASPDSVAGVATSSGGPGGTCGALDLVVEGDYAYVGDRWAGIVVVDISNPRAPSVVGTVGTADRAEELTVAGDYLYVAEAYAGLFVYDITDPAAPTFLGSIDTPHYANGVGLYGDYVCIPDVNSGIQMVQVSERSVYSQQNVVQSLSYPQANLITQFRIETSQTGSIDWEISADGGAHWQPAVPGAPNDYIVNTGYDLRWRATLHGEGGVSPTCNQVTLMTDPYVPVLVSRFAADEVDAGVQLAWEISADEAVRGFTVYRRMAPTGENRRITAEGGVSPDARRFVDKSVKGGREYWYTLGVTRSDGSELLSQTVKIGTRARALALHQNIPNPFNPTTTIHFSVPKPMPVVLSVYDVSGALVRVIASGTARGGDNVARWDGKDTEGRGVSAGVYFYRLDAAGRTLTRKMVLVK